VDPRKFWVDPVLHVADVALRAACMAAVDEGADVACCKGHVLSCAVLR
jgi:hypothetical protein